MYDDRRLSRHLLIRYVVQEKKQCMYFRDELRMRSLGCF